MIKNKIIKLFLIFGVILFNMVGVVGCNNIITKEKINIVFIINGENYIVQIEKGTILDDHIVPNNFANEEIELYFDKEFKFEYDGRPINENEYIYIKVLSSNLNEIDENYSFYNLQEAYSRNLLSIDDLIKISSYHNNGHQEHNNLSIECCDEIKRIAAYNMKNDELNPVANAKAEDFTIIKYYGTYNFNVVFMIDNPYFFSPTVDLEIIETVEGIDFYYSSDDRILVWQNIFKI